MLEKNKIIACKKVGSCRNYRSSINCLAAFCAGNQAAKNAINSAVKLTNKKSDNCKFTGK